MKKAKHNQYGESKQRISTRVSPQGWEGFKAEAKRLGLSAAELIDQIGNGKLKLSVNALGKSLTEQSPNKRPA